MSMASLRFLGSLAGVVTCLALMGCQPPATSESTPPPPAPPQPVIALLSDFGWSDSYVAQMKGAIVTIDAGARLLDLTHNVTPYNVAEGSYLLDQSAAEFPAGTIFVAVVDPGVGTERAAIVVKSNEGKFYVGPDNGIFTRVIDREGFAAAWTLDQPAYFRAGGDSHTFHGRDIFGPVAAHLALGADPARMGTPALEKSLDLLPPNEPDLAGGVVSATVLHVDRYGNVILNFHSGSDPAARFKMGNLVKITIGRESYSGPLVKTYGEEDKGRLILLYGSNGLLEIAVNQGSAASKLKVGAGTAILLKP